VEWQHDAKTGEPLQSVDKMVSMIERKLDSNETVRPRRVVVLLHDEMFRNGREDTELKQLIEKLKAKSNYRFDHLSNYPG